MIWIVDEALQEIFQQLSIWFQSKVIFRFSKHPGLQKTKIRVQRKALYAVCEFLRLRIDGKKVFCSPLSAATKHANLKPGSLSLLLSPNDNGGETERVWVKN